jgi:hypothetical protein
MSFLRENPVKPKHWYMWPISDLFKYIKEFDEGIFQSSKDPEWEIFLWQQKKTAILIMMFGFLRPGELAQISAKRWEKIENQGIFIEVEIKGHLGAKSKIFIAEIRDVSSSAVHHMEILVASTVALIPELKRQEDLEFLFTNPRSRERLAVYALSHAIHKVLVDSKLTPNNCYSVKSAAVSFFSFSENTAGSDRSSFTLSKRKVGDVKTLRDVRESKNITTSSSPSSGCPTFKGDFKSSSFSRSKPSGGET